MVEIPVSFSIWFPGADSAFWYWYIMTGISGFLATMVQLAGSKTNAKWARAIKFKPLMALVIYLSVALIPPLAWSAYFYARGAKE